jgi:hypothetical protein
MLNTTPNDLDVQAGRKNSVRNKIGLQKTPLRGSAPMPLSVREMIVAWMNHNVFLYDECPEKCGVLLSTFYRECKDYCVVSGASPKQLNRNFKSYSKFLKILAKLIKEEDFEVLRKITRNITWATPGVDLDKKACHSLLLLFFLFLIGYYSHVAGVFGICWQEDWILKPGIHK